MTGASVGHSALSQSQTLSATTQVGSSLGGASVSTTSGRDTTVTASMVLADEDIAVRAGRNLDIAAAATTQTTQTETHSSSTVHGLGGGLSGRTTIYSKQSADQSTSATAVSQSTSVLSANSGNLTLQAGVDAQYRGPGQGNVTVQGADLLAKDTVTIHGNAVDLQAIQDTSAERLHAESKSLTLGSQLTGTLGGAVTRITDTVTEARNTDNSRLQGALALKAGYDAYKLYNGLGQDTTTASSPADASGTAVGVSVSLSSSKSREDAESTHSTARGTNIQAGRIDITAADNDIAMTGAKLHAADISLDAQRDIVLKAAQNTGATKSSNQSSSAGLGVTLGVGDQSGFSVQISAAQARGRANGSETRHDNTQITAANGLNLKSGRDTTLQGAQLAGERISADIGGNLLVQTLQDTSSYQSKQESAGFSLSLCIPPICYGTTATGSINVARQTIDHHYQSAQGQSGLAAGSQGFDIRVAGKTELQGGAITSQAGADKNRLQTQELSYTDLQNQQDTKASSISAGYSSGANGAANVASNLMGNLASQAGLPKNGSEHSSTQSVISPAQILVTGNDAASQQAAAALTSRDASTANGALANTLTLQQASQLQQQQQRQQENQRAAEALGAVMTNVIGDVSQQMGWESGSPQKLVLHGMAGLIEVKMAGGQAAAGVAAAMVNEALTPAMAEYVDRALQERGLKPGSKEYKHEFDDLMKAGSTLVGAAAGALAGNSTQSAALGASVAVTATVNNYLKHNELKAKQQQLAACTDQACRDNVNAYWTVVSEKNNAAAVDTCITGSAEECRAKVTEVRNDIAQLSSAPDGTGLNKFTPEANNNLKQATEKYRTDLEILAQRGNAAMGTTYSSPDELAKAGYLTQQEAADLRQLRLGTMIDFAGAIVLPSGTKANGNKPVTKAMQEEAQAANRATEQARIENNIRRDDGQQYDEYRAQDSKKAGGEWDWNRVAPNNGAVPGTTKVEVARVGETLDRYGSRYGSFMSPAGIPYEQRSLAPGSRSNGYESYEVVKPFQIETAQIAPAFDQPGGGRQIQGLIPEIPDRPATVNELIKHGYLKPTKP